MKKEKFENFENKAKEIYVEHKTKAKGFLSEFKTFITRGNVLDLATGVIVGSAFTKIVNAFSSSIVMPLINAFLGLFIKTPELITILNKEPRYIEVNGVNEINPNCIFINWSSFIQAVIDFIIIALIIFIFIKLIRKFKEEAKDIDKKINKKKYQELLQKETIEKEKLEEEKKKQIEEQNQLNKIKAENQTTNELLVELINILKKED